jgi:phosphomannomutase/phosphoglucomutase
MEIEKQFSAAAFGKNDIRGKVGEDLCPELFELIGKGFAKYVFDRAETIKDIWISVAQDARLHSPELTDALIKGLRSCGINVLDLGLCPSPLGYFSEYAGLDLTGAMVVTASHNPPEYNGIKMTYNKVALNEDEIVELKDIVFSGDFPIIDEEGDYKKYDIVADYIKIVGKPFVGKGKDVKVVVDSGNATGGVVAPQLYTEMGCEVIDIFTEPDGNFPNHHPDPSKEKNVKDLKAKILETGADFGIAFDGDSDRIGVVDNRANFVSGDTLMLIYALDILENRRTDASQKPVFVSEVKCSQVLYDTINQKGGRSIMWKTGHAYIKAKMKEENAVMAGEMSGHTFFKDRYYGYDDAVYAGCRIIEIVAAKKAKNPEFKLSDIIDALPKKFTSPELRIACPNEHKYDVVEELKEILSKKPDMFANKIEDVITIDGVRLVFNDGFALIRASNTEPTFTIRFESGTQENLDNYQQKFLALLDEKMKARI